MFEAEIQTYPDLEEASRNAARLFARQATQAIGAKGSFSAALSGGSTPRRLYEILAESKARVPWGKVQLFQVDERCVPPDSPESNYRMIREAFLGRGTFPAANFHRMKAEEPDKDAAAQAYSEELRQTLGVKLGEWPRLDLILLGLGTDGHTASLFPGSPGLKETTRWVCPNFSQRLNSNRLTLTLPVLNAAADVIFLVAGADKAETVRAVIKGAGVSDSLPASLVRPEVGRVAWLLDQAAARLVR